MEDESDELEARLLVALLEDGAGDHSLARLADACGVGYATVRPAVVRLEHRGLVIDLRDQPRGRRGGPAFVRLTVKGIGKAVQLEDPAPS
jgi:DNA-binding MarR family transcriptional regulator